MKANSIFLFSCLCMFISTKSLAFYLPKVDSSGESSIEFSELEAVMSSKVIHFKWEVGAETNGSHFLIEKSIDRGETWNVISSVASLSNHNERHTYEISEINMPEEQVELFRICRVDKDQNKEVLDEVDFSYPILSNMLLIFDHKKSKRAVTITCDSFIESKGNVLIYDSEGNLVRSNEMNLIDGYNRLYVPLRSFKPGNYQVVIRNQFNDRIARRLVVYE